MDILYFAANVILDCINPDMTVNKSPDTITLMVSLY